MPPSNFPTPDPYTSAYRLRKRFKLAEKMRRAMLASASRAASMAGERRPAVPHLAGVSKDPG